MLVSFQAGNGIQEHCKNEEQNLIWTGNASPSVKRYGLEMLPPVSKETLKME
jgi:hypothetical protein